MVTAEELRPKYGLAAEYYARLFNMSEWEFREYVDTKRKENSINLTKEIKERHAEFITHHHHFGQSEPCNKYHGRI